MNDVVGRLGELMRAGTQLNDACADSQLSDTGWTTCEMAFLQFQAEERALVDMGRDLVQRLAGEVNSSDYRALALALSALNDNAAAGQVLESAIDSASDVQDRAAALQLKASLRFAVDPGQGRDLFRSLLDELGHESFELEIDRHTLSLIVLRDWFQAEVSLGSCAESAKAYVQLYAAARELPAAVQAAVLGAAFPEDPSAAPTLAGAERRCEERR